MNWDNCFHCQHLVRLIPGGSNSREYHIKHRILKNSSIIINTFWSDTSIPTLIWHFYTFPMKCYVLPFKILFNIGDDLFIEALSLSGEHFKGHNCWASNLENTADAEAIRSTIHAVFAIVALSWWSSTFYSLFGAFYSYYLTSNSIKTPWLLWLAFILPSPLHWLPIWLQGIVVL